MPLRTALLSICIPTKNRSALLEVLLENLVREVSPHLGKIEIIVADNASTDNTEEVVRSCSLPIVYGKQDRTVGFARNVLFATAGLAGGEYVWVIGDDDLVLPGGVSRVLESIETAQDVDYHYLNFGWVDFKLRPKIIRENNGHPPSSLLKRLQFNDTEWRRLPRLEDLAYLPSDNVSAAFSGVFCFVTRRKFFVDAVDTLHPSDSLDGSSTLIDDCFPHAILSLPRVVGRPIAYVGTPSLLQGISGWEWGDYAYKNMIFGTHQFFKWLETTAFAEEAMAHLWQSYYRMAGRLFFRMLYYRDEHKGLDIVLDDAIPSTAGHVEFWNAFMEESRLNFDTDHDARNLSALAARAISKTPDAKMGLWGILGRGQRFVKFSPQLLPNLVWVADKNEALIGTHLEGTKLNITDPETLGRAHLDILVIGARDDFVDEIIQSAKLALKPSAMILSIRGTHA